LCYLLNATCAWYWCYSTVAVLLQATLTVAEIYKILVTSLLGGRSRVSLVKAWKHRIFHHTRACCHSVVINDVQAFQWCLL
jgi:hypothetical protein